MEAQHAAVCHHLGRMTPRQIRSLRDYLKMSRAEFASFTGIGEASMARWEQGSLIQNAALDNYLVLLAYEDNLRRLREKRSRPLSSTTTNLVVTAKPVFPNLQAENSEDVHRDEMKSFCLCK